MTTRRLSLTGLTSLPDVRAGDDLPGLILAAVAAAGERIMDHAIFPILRRLERRRRDMSISH